MRSILSILLIIITGQNLWCQDQNEIRMGTVSYITSQSVYVRFNSMKGIMAGDTLYIIKEDKQIPALHINNLSSISCVCSRLSTDEFNVSENVYAILERDVPDDSSTDPVNEADMLAENPEVDSTRALSEETETIKQDIRGRLSVSSYSNLYDGGAGKSQRMRYTFSMRANNLGNSKLSAESYISFAHSNTDSGEVKNNIFTGLKLYNLSVGYAFDETMSVWLGRKINPKLSSVGAVDGLQFEKNIGAFTVGAIAGSRPDYKDYSINPHLFQYGIYLGHEFAGKNGRMHNSLAFIDQKNHFMTDRRFLYFQHTNMLIKNLYLFASAEADLFKNVNETPETILELSNTYVSLRYRVIRPLSVRLSYSSRRPIIYYEAYKNFLDRLLDSETLQGWRMNASYHPVKYLYIRLNAGYRFRKEDPNPAKNLRGAITYSQVPKLGASVSLSCTWLETSYLNGMVYGLGISKNLLSDKLTGGFRYRYVDYFYGKSETSQIQQVGEVNLSWMIYGKLMLSVFYEGTFEKETPYNRLYINLTQRF